MYELQAWITACRTFLKTNMGSYLLRTGRDESLLVGDLHLTLRELQDLDQPAGGHIWWADSYVQLENCAYHRVMVFSLFAPCADTNTSFLEVSFILLHLQNSLVLINRDVSLSVGFMEQWQMYRIVMLKMNGELSTAVLINQIFLVRNTMFFSSSSDVSSLLCYADFIAQ
jgi:hypothetical protein